MRFFYCALFSPCACVSSHFVVTRCVSSVSFSLYVSLRWRSPLVLFSPVCRPSVSELSASLTQAPLPSHCLSSVLPPSPSPLAPPLSGHIFHVRQRPLPPLNPHPFPPPLSCQPQPPRVLWQQRPQPVFGYLIYLFVPSLIQSPPHPRSSPRAAPVTEKSRTCASLTPLPLFLFLPFFHPLASLFLALGVLECCPFACRTVRSRVFYDVLTCCLTCPPFLFSLRLR